MAFALMAIGWAIAQACIWMLGNVAVHVWYIIIGIMHGLMAGTVVAVAATTRNPVGSRSLFWIPMGWGLGTFLWYLGCHLDPLQAALWGMVIGMVGSAVYTAIDNQLPKICELCGQKAHLTNDLELSNRPHRASVYIDYGHRLCMQCEAKLLQNTVDEVNKQIQYRIEDIKAPDKVEVTPRP